MAEFALFVEGLEAFEDIEKMSDQIRLKAAQAINKITRDGRSMIAMQIAREVNFPPGYLNPSKKKLYVAKQANRGDLEGVIRASSIPSSLARFAQGNLRPSQRGGVTVRVGRTTQTLRRAFLMKLRAGNSPLETRFNLGLAIRLRPGESLANKKSVRRISSGLYLLYGPSVDQVFASKDGTGVAEQQSDRLAKDLEAEFLRLMDL
jgi:hypothetical protein